jgi:hypothetical protein
MKGGGFLVELMSCWTEEELRERERERERER